MVVPVTILYSRPSGHYVSWTARGTVQFLTPAQSRNVENALRADQLCVWNRIAKSAATWRVETNRSSDTVFELYRPARGVKSRVLTLRSERPVLLQEGFAARRGSRNSLFSAPTLFPPSGREPAEAYGLVEVDDAAQQWYERAAEERNRLADSDAPLDSDHFWGWSKSVREQWVEAQWWDENLWPVFEALDPQLSSSEVPLVTAAAAPKFKKDIRLAPSDGLLEKEVQTRSGPKWVPIVPDGQATRHLTWKRWVFSSCMWACLARTEVRGRLCFWPLSLFGGPQ